MVIETVEWDSKFFGYKVGKMSFSRDDHFDLEVFEKLAAPYQLVYIFSDRKIPQNDLKLVDEKVIFEKSIAGRDHGIANEYTLSSFNKEIHSFEQIKQLALESGMYSRFKVDQNFKNQEYERMYTSWIEQSVDKKNAFEVLVATKSDHAIAGFLTLGQKSKALADIRLVAVSATERGKGVARGLLHQSFSLLKELGYERVQVVTQHSNTPAMKLYESAGFEIKERTFIYHYWNL